MEVSAGKCTNASWAVSELDLSENSTIFNDGDSESYQKDFWIHNEVRAQTSEDTRERRKCRVHVVVAKIEFSYGR